MNVLQLGSVVVGALAELFRAFAHEEGVSVGRSQPSAVACSRLRDALSRANPRIGERPSPHVPLWMALVGLLQSHAAMCWYLLFLQEVLNTCKHLVWDLRMYSNAQTAYVCAFGAMS